MTIFIEMDRLSLSPSFFSSAKLLNVIHYISSTSDKISNSLKCELDPTIFVQMLEVSPQARHNTLHVVTALIVHV